MQEKLIIVAQFFHIMLRKTAEPYYIMWFAAIFYNSCVEAYKNENYYDTLFKML